VYSERARAQSIANYKPVPYETNLMPNTDYKDPFIAGMLSWFMMGIGQFYCKEYTKGSIFIAADLVDKTSLILLISYINSRYSQSDQTIYINWSAFDPGTKVLIISYFTVKFGVKFYSVIDAIQSANKYNSRYISQGDDRKLAFDFNDESFSLYYTYRFYE
jgi:TM2 domain-containing membrane protein YozV